MGLLTNLKVIPSVVFLLFLEKDLLNPYLTSDDMYLYFVIDAECSENFNFEKFIFCDDNCVTSKYSGVYDLHDF